MSTPGNDGNSRVGFELNRTFHRGPLASTERRDGLDRWCSRQSNTAPDAYFDYAVQTKPDRKNGPGDYSGDNGNQAFKTVVGDGEVFKPLALANEIVTVNSSGVLHLFSVSPENDPVWPR